MLLLSISYRAVALLKYLTYAKNNRAEWEECGAEVVAKLVAEVTEEWSSVEACAKETHTERDISLSCHRDVSRRRSLIPCTVSDETPRPEPKEPALQMIRNSIEV